MSELVELYSKGIKRKLANYWPAWLPATRFAIGDVGILNGYLFQKETTLDELKIKFYKEADGNASPLSITSESQVAVSLKAAGETGPAFEHLTKAEAGVKIVFGSVGAFVLQAAETFESEMGDRLNVRRGIITAFVKGIWQKDWVVITRLIRAPSATVLISESSNSSFELTTGAKLSASGSPLGEANAGLAIKFQKGDAITIVGGQNLTPLFQLSRLKTGIFSSPKFVTKAFRAHDPSLANLTSSLVSSDHKVEESLVLDTLNDAELGQD